ncbi:hypothetical protein LSAT2_030958, partial [Lamellibrachia satsuma]
MTQIITFDQRWTDCCTTMWRLCLGMMLLCGSCPDGAAAQETTECSWQELEEAVEHLKMCNPQLSAISTTILLQPRDRPDYTLTCRAVLPMWLLFRAVLPMWLLFTAVLPTWLLFTAVLPNQCGCSQQSSLPMWLLLTAVPQSVWLFTAVLPMRLLIHSLLSRYSKKTQI